ncbi:LamG-like jellyroll fold domain-containing protein [Amycolatopsis sp.]|uniref:LamG-like jellyroll fold domain-containing protein n=1 Tax=Amycolatopsis sp. TaxID=37632 RepID=UPI002DFE6E08|nr:LamG-like jellyroll fold domain-containing protein [Amycolatopsis sp.]
MSRKLPTWRRLAVLGSTVAVALATVSLGAASAEPSTGWKRLTPPLSTPWTGQVSPTNALPEYPRPQLTRDKWQNLNGVWQFAAATAGQAPPTGVDLAERILVPYPVESALSGIMRHETLMWYRRTFEVPKDWKIGKSDQRLLMHFQAVDWDATVYVNGKKVTQHTGAYDAFSVDVTDALKGKGPQEIVVGVADPNDTGTQPLGKQRKPGDGIFYTPSSGIWQTVWMEPTASARIDRLDMTPDLATSSLGVTVQASGLGRGQSVEVVAYNGKQVVGRVTGAANTPLKLRVPNAHLWTPDDPYLYDLKARIVDRGHGKSVDEVGSYFGMRSISLGKGADGKTRMLLNGKFIMQVGPLDQGFWPDGIHTAPTDAALKFDLEQEKALGFNMVRKHIKVEPDRWYYHADKLGLLVWQDMPAMKTSWPENAGQPTPAARANFESELHRMIDQHKSFTSIVTWVPFNEGWGDYEVGRIADQVKAWDPSRLVNAESGVNCCDSEPDSGKGDIYDEHNYLGPGSPTPSATRAAAVGEFGGLGLKVAGHEFDPAGSFAYEMEPDSATLTSRYLQLQDRLLLAEQRCGTSASVYTQTTDVEKEVNGFFTYDRQKTKMDFAKVRQANRALIDASGSVGTTPGGNLPPGTPGPDGIAAYAFDENQGTVADDSVGAHDAALVGGAAWTAGKSGSALALNGSGQFADTGAALLDTTGNYSVAAWVKLNDSGDGTAGGAFQTVVSQDGGDHSAFFLQYSGADKRLAFSFVGTRALAPTAPVPGRWYHVAGVRDAATGQVKLYVDGQLAATKDACLGEASTGHTVIGRGQFGGNQVDHLNGAIDQVRVYDRALSDADVSALFTSGK